MTIGYYWHPSVHSDRIVFVSEDDLWEVSVTGGQARRITSTRGMISNPCFSPDGERLAFVSSEEGAQEIYLMASRGGELKRVTYFGGQTISFGWASQHEVLVRSTARNAVRVTELLKLNIDTQEAIPLNLGPATTISFSRDGHVALERNTGRSDAAHWKRYRGGNAGQLWSAESCDAQFTRILSTIDGNFSRPHWINDRIYFLSDHESIGNVYSCLLDGSDLQKHSHHKDFYARGLSGDETSLVYHAGADLYHFSPEENTVTKVDVIYQSQRPQRQRKFVSPKKYWESFQVSADGKKISLCTRGQVFVFSNWHGSVFRLGLEDSVRYRLPTWLTESHLILVCDKGGKERLEIYTYGETEPHRVIEGDFGNILKMKASPDGAVLALSNHRNELLVIELDDGNITNVFTNSYDFIYENFNWSPDSRWLVFCQNMNKNLVQVQVYDYKNKKITPVTQPGIYYSQPVFDTKGEYLYFITGSVLNPTYSDLMFDVTFINSRIPCVLPLRKETLSPFLREVPEKSNQKNQDENDDDSSVVNIEIDFTDIENRLVAFPVNGSKLLKIVPGKDSIYYTSEPIQGSLNNNIYTHTPTAKLLVKKFDFGIQKETTYLNNITEFGLSQDGKYQFVRIKDTLNISKVNEKPKLTKSSDCNSETGWIDLDRMKLLVNPPSEWLQMYGEAWRLQRDYFWVESMSQVRWQNVFDRYLPLLDRVSSRSEFTDLAWEMQGELGTSHAYVIGGDNKTSPDYPLGHLGADFQWNGDGFEIVKIYDGELSGSDEKSPLLQPGLNVKPGDVLIAIDGETLNPEYTPERALLNKANSKVELKFELQSSNSISAWVQTLSDDKKNRYRDWVEANRTYVHNKSNGKIGYVHIPDMGPNGYAEFFRNFLREVEFDGLILDARYNSGGHVSQLLLSYLSQKRIAFGVSRWVGVDPYPAHSPKGSMAVLTNQYAGSDGDVFPHAFKLLNLGPVIGKRTWGGVIGIYPRYYLLDGGLTTQPEFAFWFKDVGWGVENYGTDPDVDLDIAPHEFRLGMDPQLDRGISEVIGLLASEPPLVPNLENIPDLSR